MIKFKEITNYSKMKNSIFMSLLIISFINGFSQKVSIENASKLARDYFQYKKIEIEQVQNSNPILKSQTLNANNSNISFSENFVVKSIKDTLYYIFNVSNNEGFVIISANKRAYPILGYSFTGSYSNTDQPPAFIEWMEGRKKELTYLLENDIPANKYITNAWNSLQTNNVGELSTSTGPLLQTKWNQNCYYNALCPVDSSGPCDHAYAGCVATALAQIMRYWSYPEKGSGSYSYSHPKYGNISVNFDETTYNWSNMTSLIFSDNFDISTLLFHVGVSVDMYYGSSSSFSYSSSVVSGLRKYFNYSTNSEVVSKYNYSEEKWRNLLINEIDSLRPIFYTGTGNIGHAFVCDGYKDSVFFHFNWGWGGGYDGYYYLSGLYPGSYNITNEQTAIIRIYPGNGSYKITSPASNIRQNEATLNGLVNPNDLITNMSFEYGTTTSYGSTIKATQSPVCGNENIYVNASLSGLLPGVVYHFRVKMENAIGTSYGNDFSFTTEGGWLVQKCEITRNLYSVFFTDPNYGYIGCSNGYILKTTNGGTDWILQNKVASGDINDIFFDDSNTGYVISNYSIQKTTNAGLDWISQKYSTNNALKSVYFSDAKTGYIAVNFGTILKTADGGAKWSEQNSGNDQIVGSTFFTDSNTGYIVGNNGTILKTINGGNNWTKQISGTTQNLNDVFFTDDNIGYIVGDYGTLLKTTNAGNDWISLTSGSINNLRSIYFINAYTGFAVGGDTKKRSGTILKTINGGENWMEQIEEIPYLNSIYFTSNYKGYAVGNTGTILTIDLPVPGQPATPSGLNELCINSVKTDYFTSGAADASSYLWEIIPADAGSISGDSLKGMVIWNPLFSGTAQIKVIGKNNFGAGKSSDPLLVTIYPQTVAGSVFIGNKDICLGQTTGLLTLDGYSGDFIKWQKRVNNGVWSDIDNSTNTNAEVPSSIGAWEYRVEVQSGVCSSLFSTSEIIIVNEKPTTPIITLVGNVMHSNVPLGNQWYKQNGKIIGAINQDYTALNNGDYFVIVSLGGCSSDTSNIIHVDHTRIQIIIENRFINIYPNPFLDELIIEIEDNNEMLNFEILNAIGKVVFKGNIVKKVIVQTVNYAPGVYMVILENGKLFEFNKITKK